MTHWRGMRIREQSDGDDDAPPAEISQRTCSSACPLVQTVQVPVKPGRNFLPHLAISCTICEGGQYGP